MREVTPRFRVDERLADARADLDRVQPEDLAGAVVVDRNGLEWRLDQ